MFSLMLWFAVKYCYDQTTTLVPNTSFVEEEKEKPAEPMPYEPSNFARDVIPADSEFRIVNLN